MASISSRSITRPCHAAWSACGSRHRRTTTTRWSTRLLKRWSTCGIASVCVGASRRPRQNNGGFPSVLERWWLYRPFRSFAYLLLRAGTVSRQQRHGQRYKEDAREVVRAHIDRVKAERECQQHHG